MTTPEKLCASLILAHSKIESNPYFRAIKRSKFSESKIISVLDRNERGEKVKDLCRELGISQPTFYHWKSKYGGFRSAS